MIYELTRVKRNLTILQIQQSTHQTVYRSKLQLKRSAKKERGFINNFEVLTSLNRREVSKNKKQVKSAKKRENGKSDF